MIKSIPIREFPGEAVTMRHRIKLKNCVLESLPPEMIFGYATASLSEWNGTTQDICVGQTQLSAIVGYLPKQR